jgi:allantoinase
VDIAREASCVGVTPRPAQSRPGNTVLVRGGTVVTAEGERRADVLVRGGVFERVAPGIPPDGVGADEVVDASGLHVLPGLIDPHVHTRDPGQTHKEDIAHCTRAAAAGGITTVLAMPNTVPPVRDAQDVEDRVRRYEPTAHVDFGLWGLVVGGESSEHLAEVRDAGAVAVKLFWGYALERATGALVYSADGSDPDVIPAASSGDVWRLFRSAAEAGVLVGVHCEDHAIVTEATRAHGPARGPLDLLRTRPPEAETVSVTAVIELARASGARAHVLHTSAARSVTLIRRALVEGVAVTAETCPHYLALEPDGPAGRDGRLKVYPPVRGAADAEELWQGVIDGTIGSLSSDHAPHAEAERDGPYERQPAGIAGTQTMVPVLLDAARRRGVPLALLVDRLSTGTARLFGLHPRKGSLEPGADADLTLVDLERPWRIEPDAMCSRDRRSPWEGADGRGAPVMTIVRGRVVARDGQPVGGPTGRMVRPVRAGSGVRARSAPGSSSRRSCTEPQVPR